LREIVRGNTGFDVESTRADMLTIIVLLFNISQWIDNSETLYWSSYCLSTCVLCLYAVGTEEFEVEKGKKKLGENSSNTTKRIRHKGKRKRICFTFLISFSTRNNISIFICFSHSSLKHSIIDWTSRFRD